MNLRTNSVFFPHTTFTNIFYSDIRCVYSAVRT